LAQMTFKTAENEWPTICHLYFLRGHHLRTEGQEATVLKLKPSSVEY